MAGRKRIDINVTKNADGQVFMLRIIGTQESGRVFLNKRPTTREGCLVAFWDIGIAESSLDHTNLYQKMFKDKFGDKIVVKVVENKVGSHIQPENNRRENRENGSDLTR